jgi:CHAD domain-containing protein
MAKARPIPGLAAAVRFGDAAAATVETRTREVFEHAAGPMDVDGVHDARVATRRLRAALEIFAPSFPRKRHKRLLREVKRLADALGARRDPDVALARLEKLAGELPEHEAAEIRGLIGELRDEQAIGRERVARTLAEARASDLEARLLALAEEARR